MILDTLENLSTYLGINKNLDHALLWLQNTDLQALAPGKYPICGEDVFCIAKKATLDPARIPEAEAHRQYLDIHVALESGERIAFADVGSITAWSPYDPADDAQTAPFPPDVDTAAMRPRMFAVCFPQDAHCPLLTTGDAKTVKKLVVKVRCEHRYAFS